MRTGSRATTSETDRALARADFSAARRDYDRAAELQTPGGVTRFGHAGGDAFWLSLRSAFPSATFAVHHRIGRGADPMRPPRAALRWSLDGTHDGFGAFGPPSGARVHVMGISHAEYGSCRALASNFLGSRSAPNRAPATSAPGSAWASGAVPRLRGPAERARHPFRALENEAVLGADAEGADAERAQRVHRAGVRGEGHERLAVATGGFGARAHRLAHQVLSDLLSRMVGGYGSDFWDVLEPLRVLRPVNGGPAWTEEAVMDLRLLNFELG